MKSKGNNLQIKIRDKDTGEEGWIYLPDLLAKMSSVIIEQIKLEQEIEKEMKNYNGN